MVGSELVSALDEVFSPFNRSDVPGLVVGIAQQGKLFYRRGFGLASMELSVANTPHTRMRIGSTSKHFTALLALLLAEDGKLDLDAPIRTYLAELTGPGGDPTVRQLLQHRGGSRCYLDVGFIARGLTVSPKGTGLAAQVRQMGRNFEPGTAMIYNNGGYHLVSIAIERTGGASFEEQLKQRLFEPLGMVNTASIPSDYVITPGIAAMHVPTSDGSWRRGLFPSEEVRGEGAIVSTVDDMLRWAEHLRTRERFGSPATWAQLTELPTYPDDTVGKYALGLMIQSYRGVRIVHHAGGVIGGSSQFLTVPDHGLDIVILSNGAPGGNPMKLADQALDIILAEHLGEPAPTVTTADYKDLLGDWWSPDSGMIYGVVDDNERLSLSICGAAGGFPLERNPDGKFVSTDVSIGAIELGLDDAAKGTGLTVRFGGQSGVYHKVSKSEEDADAFVAAAVGEYFSADADCEAVISREGERIVLRFSDRYGQVESELTPFGEQVAHGVCPAWGADLALNFSKQGGRMTGFLLHSMRTRNLAFERKQDR
jgi:D-aminopeptidase